MSNRSSLNRSNIEPNRVQAQAAEDSTSPVVWTPTMGIVVAVIFAFFLGMFVGQELLHRPQVVLAQATPKDTAAAAPGGAASDSSTAPAVPSEPELKAAIAKETDPARLEQLASHLYDQQRPDLALPALERVVVLKAATAETYRNLATMYMLVSQPEKAESAIRSSIHMSGGDAASFAFLGLVLEKKHDLAGARTQLEKALSLSPSPELRTSIEAKIARLGK